MKQKVRVEKNGERFILKTFLPFPFLQFADFDTLSAKILPSGTVYFGILLE